MDTVTVYRVEQPDGSGPYFDRYGAYRWDDRLERMRSDHSDEAHPSPRQDPMLETIDIYEQSCFESLEQLTKWFKGWMVRLAEEGYAVSEYSVQQGLVRYGEHQAVVYAKKARYVRSLSLLNIVTRKA